MTPHILKRILFCFILVVTTLLPYIHAQAQCSAVSQQDSLDLVALYNNTSGETWLRNDNWLTAPVETWYGVTLTNDACFVREIILTDNHLNGTLPTFTALTQLQKLILAGNQLTGNLPNLDSMTQLEELYFALNQLNGSLPGFENNPNLAVIDFAYNQLSGSLPSFANNLLLKNIDLSGNQLTGGIPNYSYLTELIRLKLPYNDLTGEMPLLTNPLLEEINVGDNELVGTIPVFSLPNLVRLSLYANNFEGDCPDLSNFPNLYKFSATGNNLTGSLPNLLDNPLLETFDIAYNQITGTIPAHYATLPQMVFLNISNNRLAGIVPKFSNPLLEELYLGNNQLSGEVPNFQLPSLYNLDICTNLFAGAIPNFSECLVLNTSQVNFSCVAAARISGVLYADQNGNCQHDPNEPTLPHVLVTLNNNEQYTFTDDNGYYELLTDIGSDTVRVVPANDLWQNACADSYIINITTAEQLVENTNIGLQSTNICPVLLVDISTDRLRRCYSNTYTINYCNQGTQNATNAYLQVFLPESITILDASQTYTVNNGHYEFAVGDVLVGECNTITVTDSVACGTPLGTAVCAEAYIFPNPSCYDPSPLWDGSNLESDATCLGNSIQFIITNNGSAMNDSTEYRIYEDDLVNVFSKIKLEAGEQKEIMVAANNATYRLVANQTPNNPNSTYTQTVIENCNNNNSLGFVISQSENDLQPNYENDCHEVVGAYDPNDKMAVPRGMSEEHLLPPNEGITYTIRFQNTGSDTAYRVMLVDTLALEWLDVASLHISAASHAYQVRIENGKTLIVTFNNIMLPDSSTNVAGSQGYISFKVLQKVDNPMRTRIANFADIYFDYNDAVRTPTIFHTIGQALINHSPTTESPNNNTHIYSLNPNPINNILSISIDALPTDADIALVNLCGTIVLQQNLQTQHSLVSTQQLPNGMYIYRITNAKQQVIQTGKLIIIH